MSQASIDESLRRMSIQESGTYAEDERNANSYNGTSSSRANSIVQQQQQQDSYRDPPRNAYSRSNVSDLLRYIGTYYHIYFQKEGKKIKLIENYLDTKELPHLKPNFPKNIVQVICIIEWALRLAKE